jgi:hypothetical protein
VNWHAPGDSFPAFDQIDLLVVDAGLSRTPKEVAGPADRHDPVEGKARRRRVAERRAGEARGGVEDHVYLHRDSPAGREPVPVMRALAAEAGLAFRAYALPEPG